MALVGGGIGLMFALSLVLAPLLVAHIGLSGLFALTAVLALMGVVIIIWWVPPEPIGLAPVSRGSLATVLRNNALLRLDLGVFILHAVQLSMWMAVPAMLVQAGLPRDHHWWVYLPAVLASFGVMGATLFPLERRGYLRAVFLVAVGLVMLVQAGLWLEAGASPGLPALALFERIAGSLGSYKQTGPGFE